MGGKRVLILSASAGTGHVRAAMALDKAFRQEPGVGEVVTVDALKFTNKLFRDFYSKLYVQLVVKAPSVVSWVYKITDEPWKTDRMRLMLDRLNTRPLVNFISEFDPDITVCTHFLPAELISYLIDNGQLHAKLSIVVTDFACHAMWLCRVFHHYFVASEEAKVHLTRLGLPEDRITVSGVPIDPVFRPVNEREKVLQELGMDPELPLLLVSGGALGVSPVEAILEELSFLGTPAQVVVICGRNEVLAQRIRLNLQLHPHPLPVHVIGYTDQMHRWMAAATLLIGKPGGLTASEAMAMGLPMVIVSPIPGQEERNSDYLLERGIAIKCNELTTLAFKVEQLLRHPEQLAQMRKQALAWSRPDAGQVIVQTLLSEEEEPVLVPRRQIRAAGKSK
ncbi:MGDG synthase family glycosyltransferase [Candidatus Methylacidithermus pantelleriae]|uniref:MGDG synthase family glycosyltransferase n=1 Tax=Candidatus Methylacidithermus pantelleriae TaxID=2744239 RepID=UPI001F25E301|nr:glycosyltransferase [Candidatus Methylacidithermus pantelleriae]